MQIKTDSSLAVWIVVIVATMANALADSVMLKMGFDVGKLIDILKWTELQWNWHLLKWIFFNGGLGALAIMLIGFKKSFFLSIACLVIWHVIYYATT